MLNTASEHHHEWPAGHNDGSDREGSAPSMPRLGKEILALLCPDWRLATLVVDADLLFIAHANSGALDMFARCDPLIANRGCLELTSASAMRRLQATMHDMLRRDLSRATVVVDDADIERTYALHLGRPTGVARRVLGRLLEDSARLIVLDVAMGNPMLSRNDIHELAVAFGLTFAELSIMALLCQGRSLAEIAGMRDVAPETVRNQSKRLLNKTRSRRQSDLVKLAVALCAQQTSMSEHRRIEIQTPATAP